MIITSPLDTDQYKFTMQCGSLLKFPDVMVKYKYKCRNKKKVSLLPIKREIEDEIEHMSKLKFSCDHINYMKSSMPYLPQSYLDILKYFKFDPSYVNTYKSNDNLGLYIEGSWFNTILFETPVLAIISECRSKYLLSEKEYEKAFETSKINLAKKLYYLSHLTDIDNFIYIEFGTRRRFCKEWQILLLKELTEKCKHFIGSSNVEFSRLITKMSPKGTHAHEWFEVMQGLINRTSIENSQRYGLQTWADIFRGDLGIALSDTLGMNKFLIDFDKYFAKLFDGCRQDSGDPYNWGDRLIEHYKKLGIDSNTKTTVFSDGLDFTKAINIYRYFYNRINSSFGIGTWLTNDCGVEPLQIVIKVIEANGRPVAKISDSIGKQMCESKEYMEKLSSILNIPKEKVGR